MNTYLWWANFLSCLAKGFCSSSTTLSSCLHRCINFLDLFCLPVAKHSFTYLISAFGWNWKLCIWHLKRFKTWHHWHWAQKYLVHVEGKVTISFRWHKLAIKLGIWNNKIVGICNPTWLEPSFCLITSRLWWDQEWAGCRIPVLSLDFHPLCLEIHCHSERRCTCFGKYMHTTIYAKCIFSWNCVG